MTHGIARIRLDDGTPVWARVSEPEELRRGGGFTDTGIGDRVVSMAEGLTDVVRGVVGSLRGGLDPQSPVEVSVSFGIELSAQAGKVISVLAEGGGTASIAVSLTWTEPGPAQEPAQEPQEPAPVPGSAPEPAPVTGPATVPGPAHARDDGPSHRPAADGAV
ncbi:CU044_2847 family protein [Streptomyces sp. P9(2023)]|uniref:CU044_2847 family protein n=1 Tax=Streptomyces sp. P9(2023) TaxID=3064394 RepID=UPI0028F40D6C|nr:CU044_2847 family protein [Streptomyces sp. P9(2023)]MDT9688135.1 CU044_2847 family protein [Streptomyces sp. P9(2023)]